VKRGDSSKVGGDISTPVSEKNKEAMSAKTAREHQGCRAIFFREVPRESTLLNITTR